MHYPQRHAQNMQIRHCVCPHVNSSLFKWIIKINKLKVCIKVSTIIIRLQRKHIELYIAYISKVQNVKCHSITKYSHLSLINIMLASVQQTFCWQPHIDHRQMIVPASCKHTRRSYQNNTIFKTNVRERIPNQFARRIAFSVWSHDAHTQRTNEIHHCNANPGALF